MPNTGHTTNTSFSIFADFSTKKQALNSFNDLAEVVGGTDLITFLPEEVQGSSGLQVEKFEISVQSAEQSEISVDIEVGMDKAWTVIEEVFVIEEIRSRFYVKNPFTSASRDVAFSLAGKLEIGGGSLAVSANFAENQQQLFAKLEEGDKVDLLQVFEQLGIPLGEVGVDNFECSVLEIEIDALTKSYKFDIKLDTAWSVFGSDELQVGDLLFKANADFDSDKKEYAYQVDAKGEIILGGATINIAAVYEDIGGWNFKGFTKENEPAIPIGRLIGDLSEGFGGLELPTVLDDLQITRLEVSFSTLTQDFRLICQTSIEIGTGSAELSLIIDIRLTANGYIKLFAGELTIEGKTFAISFISDNTTSSLIALFQDRRGADLNLIDFLNAITNDKLGLSDQYNLAQLTIYLLRLSYQKNKSTGNTRYEFLGDFAWEPDLGLGGGGSLEIDASVKLIKESGQALTGEICGAINTPIEFLEFLRIAACYEFGPSGNALKLQLRIGEITFEAEYPSNDAGDFILSFGLKLDSDNGNKFTLGDIISFFAALVDPSIEEFEFNDPWNFLVEFNLFDLLEHVKLTLSIEKTSKKKIFGFTFDRLDKFVPDVLKPLLSINSLTFDFTGKEAGNTSSKKFNLSLDAKFLGINQTLEWDPINEDPPEIPGAGSSVFDLRYLGFGQHIAFTGVGQVESIKEVMGLLRGTIDHADGQVKANRALKNRNPMELFGDGGPIAFSPESDWLIGMDLTLLKFLSLKVIFNDPLIYGLRIELAGEAAQNFAGLQFEILYRRITDTVGVYHLELTLPDFVRYLQFGAVSITLPVLVLDIFTNGDFKVDLGFPWNFNFARSFSLEIFPFIGSGGIYFNKLSAATATSTPRVLGGDAQGIFTPVYEFGLGLSIGLGKTFNAGPLRAEISLMVQGILEGVISWYNPRMEGERELYYLVRGGIAIVGRLYGAVDFGIIRVDVEVLAIAKVQFVVEVYKKIYISLSAKVSVRASIKIVFVRIRFSFSLRVEQNFTIGSDKLAPWDSAVNTRQIASRTLASSSLSRSIAGFSWGVELWPAGSTQKVLDIFFQPAFSWTPSGVKGEALFFIENSINASSSDRKDFDELVKMLLRWVWKAYSMDETQDSEDFAAKLEELYEVFADDNSPLFTYVQLQHFLGHHFIFRLSECKSDIEGSLFPVFPHLSMTLGDDGKANSFEEVGWQLDEIELQSLKTYFNQLKVQFDQEQNDRQGRNVSTRGIGNKTAITEFVFADYFRLLIRSALQVANDFVKENENSAKNMLALVEELGANQAFGELAGMASRFFLYGLHLPQLSEELPAQALYQATGQQFELAAATGTLGAESGYKVQISVTPLAQAETPTIHFELPTDAGLTYFLQQTEDKTYVKYSLVETLNILQSQQLEHLTLASPSLEAMPFYRHEKLNFALRKWIIWNHTAAEVPTPATSEYILPFPFSLTNYLLDKSTNPTIGLAKDKLSDNSDTLGLQKIEPHLFYWGTQVEVQIRLIPQTEEAGFLGDTYVISGMSEAEHELLEDVWIHLAKAGVANVNLSLLRLENLKSENGENTTQLVDLPASNSDILILKNNLSTESNFNGSQSFTRSLASGSSTVLHAKADQIENFIQLIWEANTVNTGGYFLHIPNEGQLNDNLFAGVSEASLTLVIHFEDRNAPIFDFHNCAIYKEDIEISEYLITAQSTETVAMLEIPAGHLGLQLRRPEATEDYPIVKLKKKTELKTAPDDDLVAFMQLKKEDEVALSHISNDGKWVCVIYQTNIRGWIEIDEEILEVPNLDHNEVDNLYQLLGYEIESTTSLESHAPQGLPIGPTGEETWVYERLISTAKLFNEGSISNGSDLPPTQQNPYLGIADKAELKVKSWWNDLYGNQLLEKSSENTFAIRYTDPIIGINEWPSVAESYEFTPHTEQQANLKIDLSFDRTPYEAETNTSEENRLNKIKAALVTYKQIYYQLLAEDTILQLDTSVLNGTKSFHVDKSRLLSAFIEAIYQYLSGLLSGLNTSKPPVYAETFLITFDDSTQLLYKEAFIFNIEVTIDIKREIDLIHADLKNEDGILAEYKSVVNSKTYLSPKLNPAITDQTQSLRDFARNFEATFRHLKLAVSALPSSEQTNAEKQSRRPLWAVHLSDKGVNYNIQEELPAFFAIPPLANSLKSAKVMVDDYASWKSEQLQDGKLDLSSLSYQPTAEEKQFDALDINVLARDFLVAVEEFLEVDSLVSAYQLIPDRLTAIVEQKARLATAISAHIVPILSRDIGKNDQLLEAKSAIKQQLLIHLVEGYDIETIVQYEVDVKVGSHLLGKLKWEAGQEPRMAGKAVIVAAYQGTGDNRKEVDIQSLDFSLAAGKIPLKSKEGKTYFTYLFDTRSPEKFSNIYLELAFKSTEIEYNIAEINGINQYEASAWLSFVLPDSSDPANDMGTNAIPIPLRNYPMPPSLIFHQAEADPDSELELSDVRQWTYSCMYEHPDVAQDTIDCVIKLNVPPPTNIQARSLGIADRNLFEALVNFSENYAALSRDLALIQKEEPTNNETLQAQIALVAFEHLVSEVSLAWGNWNLEVAKPSISTADLHYELREEINADTKIKHAFIETLKTISPQAGAEAPEPVLALPTYFEGQVVDNDHANIKEYTFESNPKDTVFFGDSSIPDRKFSIENLDVIHQQNAWATIWLSRNKELIPQEDTNPIFVFQTPEVKFNSKITPSLVNDERWDINLLAATSRDRSLLGHLTRMFKTILPQSSTNDYEIRMSCRYAFIMTAGTGLSQDLLSMLPMLMGLRLNKIDEQYILSLANKIEAWRLQTKPSENKAAYIFSINIFSKLDPNNRENLPLLKIEHLQLNLEDIE